MDEAESGRYQLCVMFHSLFDMHLSGLHNLALQHGWTLLGRPLRNLIFIHVRPLFITYISLKCQTMLRNQRTYPYTLMLLNASLCDLLDFRMRKIPDFGQRTYLAESSIFLARGRDYDPAKADLVCPFDQDLIVGDSRLDRNSLDNWVDGSTWIVCDGREGGVDSNLMPFEWQ